MEVEGLGEWGTWFVTHCISHWKCNFPIKPYAHLLVSLSSGQSFGLSGSYTSMLFLRKACQKLISTCSIVQCMKSVRLEDRFFFTNA